VQMTRLLRPAVVLAVLAAALPAPAQQATPAASPAPAAPAAPAANAADVASVESIVAALYDVISGPPGKKRDWARMKSLFHEGARLVPTGARPNGGFGSRVLDVDGYIERSSPFFEKEGFYEREFAHRVESFGQIAHVFSSYESRHEPSAEPFARGINSIQLVNDGKRWWILTILWEGESDALKIPPEYRKSQP
jgi:hypothetical protein